MKCKAKNLFYYWFPPIIYEIIIIYISSIPLSGINPDIKHIDKLYHALLYFVLAFLLWRALYYASTDFFKKRAGLYALIFTIILGLTDEFHQYFVPFRYADIFDLFFDTIGACLAVIGINWWWNGRKNY